MGRQSVKANKSVYQLFREDAGLTREAASDLMIGVSPSRIEKIENGQDPTPYDILQMSKCYKHPELCNIFCTKECAIGAKYVPAVESTELPSIILETIASLNDIQPLTTRLIEITRDGKVSDEEIRDFAIIQKKLSKISAATTALQLWADKMIYEKKINEDVMKAAKESIGD